MTTTNSKTYRLRRLVANPDADGRRRNDWRYAKAWAAGAMFVIEESADAQDPLTMIHRVGHRSVAYGRQLAKLIADNADVVEETPAAMLTRLNVEAFHARGFYLYLIKSGRFTAAEFEEVWNAYLGGEEP